MGDQRFGCFNVLPPVGTTVNATNLCLVLIDVQALGEVENLCGGYGSDIGPCEVRLFQVEGCIEMCYFNVPLLEVILQRAMVSY